MGWFGFALALVGVLANLILWVIFKSTDYNLSLLPYMWLALIVWAVGSLLVVADEARAILARRKIQLGKKDQLETKKSLSQSIGRKRGISRLTPDEIPNPGPPTSP